MKARVSQANIRTENCVEIICNGDQKDGDQH